MPSMCCGMHAPINAVAPPSAGWIKPGETVFDAAARRHREKQKLSPAKGKMLDGPASETSTLASLSSKGSDPTQGYSEKDPKVSTVGSEKKSRRSFSDRWSKFKRQYLP